MFCIGIGDKDQREEIGEGLILTSPLFCYILPFGFKKGPKTG